MDSHIQKHDVAVPVGIILFLRRLRKYPVLGYGVAIFVVGLASGLQWLLRDQYAGAPFLTIYPAVIVATLVGGLGPGLSAAILSGGSQFGLFIPDFHWIALASYGFDATVCVMLIVLINGTMDLLWASAEREKEAKQHQFVVASELHHRIQNLFTVIQAIIRFSIPATGLIQARELRARLLDRVQSMAAANRAITDSMGEGVRLIDLVRNEICGFATRVDISGGSDVVLSAQMTQNFSLIIHELLTNALKHGALSVPNGRISIAISREAAVLRLIWQEHGAPPPGDSESAGFGSLLLGTFAKSFCQSVQASYQPGGLRYALKIQFDEIKGPQPELSLIAAE